MKTLTTELTNFFELSENYLCILSPDLRFKKLNPSWLKLGYSHEELISHVLYDFIHHEDLDEIYKQVERLTQSQRSINFTSRYKKNDGSYIILEWSASKNPDRELIFGSAIDVTDRIKRERLNEHLSDLRGTFIHLSHDKIKFFKYVLQKVLLVTKSAYGFVGEILEDKNGKYLKTYALTDISWNKETQDFYQKNYVSGIEFRNLNTLFGEVIKTGELLITNNAPIHPKAGGIPKGHPALNSFMGIPISNGG